MLYNRRMKKAYILVGPVGAVVVDVGVAVAVGVLVSVSVCFRNEWSYRMATQLKLTILWKFLWEYRDQKSHRIYVAVPGRNRTLLHCVFRLHYCVQSAVTQYFHYGWGSYVLCKLMNTWHTVCMSLTPNKSSALQRFERSNAIEICNEIMFDFYLGLPHMWWRDLPGTYCTERSFHCGYPGAYCGRKWFVKDSKFNNKIQQ